MIHLGDITKISGHDVPPVDVIIGGSPCQDLSIAGKREGLAGARSGLFMEQVRVVKEMRDADRLRGRTNQFIRPRYMVWENVPGAFSSNKGEDFRAVLEEIVRIAEPEAPDIPLPQKGKWPLADSYYGDGWSLAYRVLNSEFWGVPQRRRRIALVADFGGLTAPEILFERVGLSWNTPEGQETGQVTAAGAGQCADKTITMRERCGCAGGGKGPLIQEEKSGTLSCHNDQVIFKTDGKKNRLAPCNEQDQKIICMATQQGGAEVRTDDKAPTLTAAAGMSDNNQPVVYDARGNGTGQIVPTITGDHNNRVTDYTELVMATGQSNAEITVDMAPTLNCNHEAPIVAHALRASPKDPHREDAATYPITNGIVRRLTPLECERLQGFPDGWTDLGEWTDARGKKHKTTDTARYKALGNSIALPPWKWVLKRLCALYERDATMGSLFDGIGGFPLVWERLNGPGTCLWASEIEEFPIAVTERRIGNEDKSKGSLPVLR